MHPDLQYIYDELVEYISRETLMGERVNIRVEEDLYIKLYVNDENGIRGQFKKPLMIIYFNRPGNLNVKFIMLDRSRMSLLQEFGLRALEKDGYEVNFDNIEKFEKFIGSL